MPCIHVVFTKTCNAIYKTALLEHKIYETALLKYILKQINMIMQNITMGPRKWGGYSCIGSTF